MKPKTTPLLERCRLLGPPGEMCGAFRLGPLRVIASDGAGWDHVSVSAPGRTPTWDEMERVKRLFFRDDETAMQLHVPPAEHVNLHAHCLHLWRPQTSDEIALAKLRWGAEWPPDSPDRSPGVIPRPPAECV